MTQKKAVSVIERQSSEATRDLWVRLRQGMTLQEHYSNPGIEKQVTWYKNSQSYIDLITQRGQRYLYHIIGELEAKNMPLELAMLPAVESAYDPLAYSHSHASGLWQFIPGTGKRFGLQRDWWYDGRRDPVASTEAAINYLTYLHNYFDGDWLLALAAYNSGEGTVKRAIKKNKRKGKPTDFWSLSLPKETRAYVPQLLAISRIIANPEKHGVNLPSLVNQPYFTRIEVPEQIDLTRAAKMAGIEADEIHHLNAGYNRWVTHPEGPQQLLLPIESVNTFRTAMANTPRDQWTPIKQYQVKSGDTLSGIAQRHQVLTQHLRNKNDLRSDFLRVGQKLKIPGTGFDSPTAGAVNIYTVKNGDSLWKIAKNQKVSIRNIARWNNLDVKSPLRLGQQLKVQAAENTANTASIRKLKYKVRHGDSLSRIASKFDIKISDILTWNKLNPKKYIKPGQRLTLFVDVLNI
ncbi:MAG: LysM peptidoglycan-binding domain-containing protein [Porticoccus sp.]|nr:LysM peptidoglycan-binding domain-containing protein [Porticoccus sp.]